MGILIILFPHFKDDKIEAQRVRKLTKDPKLLEWYIAILGTSCSREKSKPILMKHFLSFTCSYYLSDITKIYTNWQMNPPDVQINVQNKSSH